MKHKISVIIMTLNAEREISNTINRLLDQTLKVDEIIICDSQSEDRTVEIAESFNDSRIKILTVIRSEFDHGGTRDYAFRQSTGDFVFFLTQDAVIGSNDYIENLMKPFADSEVAMACGRQVAREDAYLYEKYVREFNYPMEPSVRNFFDIKTMGIKAFFLTDVCSAYRRTAYEAVGGFPPNTFICEDTLIASRAIRQGFKIAYEPTAFVIHSHNFNYEDEFKRNFDISAFMTLHPAEYGDVNVSGEGKRLVKTVSKRLLKSGRFGQFIKFGFSCLAKYRGNKKGQQIKQLSYSQVKKYSNSLNFWKRFYMER